MKKLRRDINSLIGANVGIGVGAAITGSLPSAGVSGFSPSAGLATMGEFMPIVSTAVMGGHALRLTKKLMPRRRRYRK